MTIQSEETGVKMKDYEWMRNDTAAIMFSAIDDNYNSRIFRISAVFKDEEIDPERLEKAVALTMPRYPICMYRNKKGFFWTYLEKTDSLPSVMPEEYCPAALRRLGRFQKPEMVFLYYKRRISIEASHIYGDGMGFLEILKSVIAQYMVLGGIDKKEFPGIRFGDIPSSETEMENPYIRYKTDEKIKKLHRDKAYVLPRNFDDNYQNYLNGLIDTNSLKEKCKEKNVTITEFLNAVLIYSMIKTDAKPINDTVIIDVPCNIRKIFPTDSVRNFSSSVPVHFSPEGRHDYTLSDIIEATRGQLKKYNCKETHQAFINSNYALTENKLLQPFPYCIKKPVINAMQKKSHNTEMTVLFSNMGNVTLPEIMHSKIERFDFVGGDARVYDMPLFCSAIGFNGFMNMSFNLSGKDRSLPREFFRTLTAIGIPVRIESSEENGVEDKVDIAPKMCEKCGVRIGEEYSRCPLCDSTPLIIKTKDEYFKTALFPQPYKKLKHRYSAGFNFNLSAERIKAHFILQP